MGKYSKWIGAGLGWSFGGPIGGIAGFIIGSAVDSWSSDFKNKQLSDFAMSLTVLIAATMKADGRVLKAELNFVKLALKQNFGTKQATQMVQLLGKLIKQNIQVENVCRQIQQYMNYSQRLELLHFLIGITKADGQMSTSEKDFIQKVASLLGISQQDFDSIEATIIPNTDWAYKVLEIPPTAPNQDIKKAYRRMAMKFHPDKVAPLGDEVKRSATEKFKIVHKAYESIKQQRSIA